MTDLRKAAEMALEFVSWFASGDHSVRPKHKAPEIAEALRQALDDNPAVKSYAGGKPNYCTPVDAVPGFTVTEPRQSLSRMKPGDRFVLVRTGEICHIENDGSQWNETAQRPSRFHKNSQVRLIVDAVNMSQDRVDETSKGEHEPLYMDMSQVPTGMPDWKPGMVFPAPKREWVGLTDEDKEGIKNKATYNWDTTAGEYASEVQALTEAKLKEKNT